MSATVADDTTSIVYTTGYVGTDQEWPYQIWAMRPDGSNRRALTTDPGLLPYTAAPNPLGTRVATLWDAAPAQAATGST